MVELAHDAGLGQEVPPLLVGVAGLQRLDGHADLPLARHLQAAAAHLAELPWKKTHGRVEKCGTMIHKHPDTKLHWLLITSKMK